MARLIQWRADDVFERSQTTWRQAAGLAFPQLDICTEIRERVEQGCLSAILFLMWYPGYISAQGLYSRDSGADERGGGVAQGSSEHSTLEARQEAQR